MKRSVGLATLLGLGLMTVATGTLAADWYGGPAVRRYVGPSVPASRSFLLDNAAQLGVGQVDLAHEATLPLGALRTVRFQQQYKGLPVIGKAVAVRIAADGSVRTAFVDVARNLSVATTPAVDEKAAIARVESMLGRSVPGAGATLAVLPQDDKGGVLVWQVNVASPRGLLQYVLDARTGALLSAHPLAMDALGRVYDINWVQTPTPADRELPTLVPSTPQHLVGLGGQMAVYGYVSGDVSSNFNTVQDTQPSSGEDFLYDPNPDVTSLNDPFGEVNAFYHCGRMEQYFTTKHGVDMTSSKWSLSIVTSYAPASDPSYIDNAFFTPGGNGVSVPGGRNNLIAIGRGSINDFAYDSDVFLHEYTHYVNHNAVNFSSGPFDFDQYGLVVMPGAIDEGTADYFSSSINNDPVVGEASLAALGADYARDLTAPAGRCPDTVYGESHADGGLIGTAAWAIREALGTDLGDQVVWGAVTLLTQGATLGDFGTGVLKTAQDLSLSASQIDQIKGILADRGLDDCGRSLDLHAGVARTTTMFGLDIIGQMMGGSCSQMKSYGLNLSSIFHFKHTPQADDKGVKLTVHLEDLSSPGALDWSIYARKGSMVTFSGGGGYQPPDPSVFDYVVSDVTGADGEMTIDTNSNPPFDPSSDYYFVLVHRNCPVEAASVQSISLKDLPTDAGTDGTTDPDGGADATDSDAGQSSDGAVDADGGTPADAASAPAAAPSGDDGGCGCRAAPSGSSSSAVALTALGLALVIGRRRRR